MYLNEVAAEAGWTVWVHAEHLNGVFLRLFRLPNVAPGAEEHIIQWLVRFLILLVISGTNSKGVGVLEATGSRFFSAFRPRLIPPRSARFSKVK